MRKARKAKMTTISIPLNTVRQMKKKVSGSTFPLK